MSSYLYGLLSAANAASVPARLVGLDASPVRAVSCGALTALASTLDNLPDTRDLDAIRTHDEVLQRVVDAGVTVVAARFRQSFDTDAELCADVRERGARITRVLEEFDGFVEMRILLRHADAISGQPPIAHAESSGPGRAYLEQIRERQGAHLSLAAALGPVVRGERVSLLPRDGGAVFAHLVSRDRVEEYRASVSAFPALSEARVVGPLALYSFAEPES